MSIYAALRSPAYRQPPSLTLNEQLIKPIFQKYIQNRPGLPIKATNSYSISVIYVFLICPRRTIVKFPCFRFALGVPCPLKKEKVKFRDSEQFQKTYFHVRCFSNVSNLFIRKWPEPSSWYGTKQSMVTFSKTKHTTFFTVVSHTRLSDLSGSRIQLRNKQNLRQLGHGAPYHFIPPLEVHARQSTF